MHYKNDDMVDFLERSEKRVSELVQRASRMRNTSHYADAVADLESKVPDSKVHFYGTRVMQLGHEKSHVNLFLEVGK
jgi:hypothetical protein